MPPESLFQFLQSQMAPAQAVSTGVAHSNIDNLMGKPSDYGKPFEYVSTNVGTPKALAIPLNMSRYAELIAKSGVGEAIHPFIKSEVPLSWNFLNEPASTPDTLATGRAWKSVEASQKKAMREWTPEQLQDYIVSKLSRGDDPSGIVGYYLDKYINPEGKAGYYSAGRKFADPDTVKIFQSMSRVTSPEGWPGTSQAKTGFDLFGKSAAGEYGTALHEPIHAIFGHPESWQDPGGQMDYVKVVKEMASNLKQQYGESLMKSLMDNVLGEAPLTREDTSKIKQLAINPLNHLYQNR
jgi:hypothetical protein